MSSSRNQRGVALIELALTIGILITIVFGITEFGRAIYQYDTLAKAARDAARHLSTKGPGDATAIGDARCYAVYGNPSCTGSTLAPGLTTAMVSVCDAVSCPASHQAQGAAPVVNLVSVTIGGANTPYAFISVVQFVVPNFNFGAISVTMRQVL
jgi:Flp pilus assembly protein TadG